MKRPALHSLSSFWQRLRGGHVIALWLALATAYVLLNKTALPFAIPTLREHADGHGILNTLPHYDAATAYEYLASYGPIARRVYYAIVAIDAVLLIPVYVGAFGGAIWLAAVRVFACYPHLPRVLAALPVVAGVCNLVEDALLVGLIQNLPEHYNGVATLAGMLTAAKTALITGSVLTVVVLWAVVAVSLASFHLGWRRCHV